MCGICGKVSFNSPDTIDEKLINNMADAFKYRGPDDSGAYICKPADIGDSRNLVQIGLGHRRLSIIDLSAAGHQPMSNENMSVWIVCNGEIYNFRDLRENLVNKGHIFRSNSDTEVIIHLYEDMGVDCLKELRGMFAFAIWDANRQRLFLARDRVGKKPLNYFLKDGSLTFASEIKSILQATGIEKELDTKSLDLYLTYGYIPAPQTIFSGIRKLPAAHRLIWERGQIKIDRYWQLSFDKKITLNEEECAEKTLELVTEATNIRLTSDVPLGAFLSGGIDSSVIVATMSKSLNRPVKTFSIGFEEESFNELEYARKISKLFNTDHQEYIVKFDALDVLPKLVWHFSEPFADSSAIPTYYLSRMTRQEVTVALNGDGGDELFAGYERYAANKIAGIYGFLPKFIRKNVINAFIGNLTESTEKKDFIRNLKKFTAADNLSRKERYNYWMSIFRKEMKDELYTDEFKGRLESFDSDNYLRNLYRESDASNFIDSTLFVDTMSYLPEDLLVKADVSSMANSLEARSPFLDHKLMEFAASIPASLKLKGFKTKYILKKAFSKLLPKEIISRPKHGFGVPVGKWFRGSLKNYAYGILLSRKCVKRGLFREEAIKQMLDEHVCGKIDHGHRIWSLINLELWHNIFMDN